MAAAVGARVCAACCRGLCGQCDVFRNRSQAILVTQRVIPRVHVTIHLVMRFRLPHSVALLLRCALGAVVVARYCRRRPPPPSATTASIPLPCDSVDPRIRRHNSRGTWRTDFYPHWPRFAAIGHSIHLLRGKCVCASRVCRAFSTAVAATN